MSNTKPLSNAMTQKALKHLGLPTSVKPNRHTLEQLLYQYVRTVPWESASRIVRRANTVMLEQCPVLGQKFWENTIVSGTGGTCYESNYAFYSLLLQVGYEGYLTLNNMGSSIGCHSAIVILIEDEKLLIDVGLPIFAPLPIRDQETASVESQFFTYTIESLGDDSYEIWRTPHLQHNAFTLIDQPVDDEAYRQTTTNDYILGSGLFLDKVVINKVIGDNIWRFNCNNSPLHMEKFVGDIRHDYALTHDHAEQLANQFKLDQVIFAEALEAMGLPSK
jgi:arylamine N-acetyltransferase